MSTIGILSFVLSSPAFAGSVLGPGGTGGGNGYGSSAEEVVQRISGDTQALEYFFSQTASQRQALLNPTTATDPEVQKVLAAWAQSVPAFKKDLDSSPRVVQPTPCPGDAAEGDSDASTQFTPGAPICFSTGRLSRFPVWALDPELFALIGHETAHHFGFDETAARAIQGYLYENYGLIQIQYLADMTIDSMSRFLKEASARKIPDRDLYWDQNFASQCLFISQMVGIASVYQAGESNDGYQSAFNDVSSDCLLDGHSSRAMFQATLGHLKAYDQAIIAVAEKRSGGDQPHGTHPGPTPAPAAPPTALLKCATDPFSGGSDEVVQASVEMNHGRPHRLTFTVKATGKKFTANLYGPGELGDWSLDESVEKSSGFEATISWHSSYVIAFKGIKSTAPDVLICK